MTINERGYFSKNCRNPSAEYMQLFKLICKQKSDDFSNLKTKLSLQKNIVKFSKLKQLLWNELVHVMARYHFEDTPYEVSNQHIKAILLLEKKHLLIHSKSLIEKMLQYTLQNELFEEHMQMLHKMFELHAIKGSFNEVFWKEYTETADAIALMVKIRACCFEISQATPKNLKQIEEAISDIEKEIELIKKYGTLTTTYHSMMSQYYELTSNYEKSVESLKSIISAIEKNSKEKIKLQPIASAYAALCTKMIENLIPQPTAQSIDFLQSGIKKLPAADTNAKHATLLFDALLMFHHQQFQELNTWLHEFKSHPSFQHSEEELRYYLYGGCALLQMGDLDKALDFFVPLNLKAIKTGKKKLESFSFLLILLIHYEKGSYKFVSNKVNAIRKKISTQSNLLYALILKALSKSISAKNKTKVWKDFLSESDEILSDKAYFYSMIFDTKKWVIRIMNPKNQVAQQSF